MYEFKHTMAPWNIDEFGNIWSEDTSITKMSVINQHASGYRDKSQEEHESNSKLISASPDMLEALLNVQKIIAEGASHGFNPSVGSWAIRLFESNQMTSNAIRKAGGVFKYV